MARGVYIPASFYAPLPLQARIGESFSVIPARLGQLNVEQTDKGIYNWAMDEEQSLFLTVILTRQGCQSLNRFVTMKGR